ncbi:factor-independent urate hydroxylase [Streptomyces sp. NPDC054904]
MAIVFGDNQYGKVDCRLLRVDRGVEGVPGRNAITDITVTTTLAGDFTATHLHGDNTGLLPTDSHKNTVHAYAKDGIGEIEDFALRLARHFVDDIAGVHRARIRIAQYWWDRVNDHAFVRSGRETRTASVTYDGQRAWAVSGVSDLALFQSAGSQFDGFLQDEYTVLGETRDRTYATLIEAHWRHRDFAEGRDWTGSYRAARDSLIDTFCTITSRSTQQVLYTMGRDLLQAQPDLAEVRLHMPNLHHLHIDLSPFGLDNVEEVLYPSDRPYGLMEATVLHDDAPDPGLAWW